MKIKINGKYYKFFDKLSINYKLDSVASVFSFMARLNPQNPEHREIFKPLSYSRVEIFTNENQLLLTGTVVNQNLGAQSSGKLQSISGYSLAGILEDCTVPASEYPLERNNISLLEVGRSFTEYFGIELEVDISVEKEMNLQYAKTVASPTESIKSYLSKLAAQRNIIMSHNEKGGLYFYRPKFPMQSKFNFNEQNTLSISLSVNGQAIHSDISVIRQPSKDNSNLSPVDTIRNSMIPVKREMVKVLTSGTETDTRKAANNVLADQLKSISFKVSINRFIFLKCGDLVELQSEEVFLNKSAKLLISSINYSEDANSELMAFELVLPETYTGKDPVNIFE